MRIIVTGAANGIGRAAAIRLAKDVKARGGDPRLLLVDIAADPLADVVGSVSGAGGDAHSFIGDLADRTMAAQIAAEAERRLGGLDILVSNAGIIEAGLLADLDVDAFDRTFAVNTRAAWLLAKAAFPLLKASRGCVIATASVSSLEPTPPLGAYSASKAALAMLMSQLAYEWGPFGIRCNCISPGPTHTGMTDKIYGDAEQRRKRSVTIPIGRVGVPEDMAAAIAFLASPDASFITGVNLPVDGGVLTTLMPHQRFFSAERGI